MTHDFIEFSYIIPGHILEVHAAANCYRDDWGHVIVDSLHIDVYEYAGPDDLDGVQRYQGDFTDLQWKDLEDECVQRFTTDLEEREEARSA